MKPKLILCAAGAFISLLALTACTTNTTESTPHSTTESAAQTVSLPASAAESSSAQASSQTPESGFASEPQERSERGEIRIPPEQQPRMTNH